MYFQKFPKVFYDFDKTDGDFSLLSMVDITKNVRVIKKILEDITLYDEYDMMDGETVEIVAEKIYGNPELHWVIMLVNQKYDYLRDFPMSSEEFEEYMDEQYGTKKFSVRHYERKGLVSEARAILKVPAASLENFFKTDFIVGPNGTARVDEINPSNSTITILLDSGTFTAGETCVVYGFRMDEDDSTEPSTFSWNYRIRFNFVVPQNPLTIFPEYTAITNYDYETRINEQKRRIKLISPELITQFVKEFENLIVK